MKKAFKLGLSAAIVTAAGGMATPAYAGPSDAECAIWLCLPVGFAPSQCAPARTAMIDRIKDMKSPVPPIRACNALGTPMQDHSVWGHQIGYETCRSGYVPAARGEDSHDLRQRGDVRLGAHTFTPTQIPAYSPYDTCLNPLTDNTYQPRQTHTVTLKIGSETYPYTFGIGSPAARPTRGGGGTGNVH